MKIMNTYLMSNNKGDIKIGKSKNPKLRESNLKVADSSIELLATLNKDIEAELHLEYKDYSKKGEWFSLSNKQVLEIINKYSFKIADSLHKRPVADTESEDIINDNPFVETLVILPGRRMLDYNKYNSDKEKYDKAEEMPYMYLESNDRISLYTSPTIRSVLNTLKGSSAKLFIWLLQSIPYGKDFIRFNTKRFLRETRMSPATLQVAKKELIDKQIIAMNKEDKKCWWINPAIMFKGSRSRKYPDNIALFKSNEDNINSDSKIK